jgi:hypothetical protein
MYRLAQFHSLPVEAMSKVKAPKNLYRLPWEEDEIKSEEIDWTIGE